MLMEMVYSITAKIFIQRYLCHLDRNPFSCCDHMYTMFRLINEQCLKYYYNFYIN